MNKPIFTLILMFLFFNGSTKSYATTDLINRDGQATIASNVSIPCTDSNGDILVTNTNDQGVGSLRSAISCANNTPGPNRIRFNIPGSNFHRIFVGSTTGLALPTLTDVGTTIDATTQPGYVNNIPMIGIDGGGNTWNVPINALFIQGDDCQVFGLEITNFPDDAIDVLGADNVVIGGVGSGNVIHSNGYDQDFFSGAPNTGPWNGCGIVVRQGAVGCVIVGNTIGTDLNFSSGLGNEWCAINIRDGADNCLVGGTAFGQGNIIAGNETGIRVNNSDNCLMQQNFFFCNSEFGIQLTNGGNNNIPSPTINNVFSANISGTSSVDGVIEVYINDVSACAGSPCQGRILLGTTTASNGNWSISAPFNSGISLNGGERITATLNDGMRTSEFALCRVIPGASACTNPDATIDVTNTNDEGVGSLREAIICANNTVGANTIRFNIPGTGPHVIQVGATSNEALPALTDAATTIDGTTQPGFGLNSKAPEIILDGQVPVWNVPINALFIRADFCQVFALEIINFPDDGIDITSANYCVIGAPDKGNVIYDNGDDQDFFPGAPNSGPWNGCGIVLKGGSDYNIIKGNTIGTDYGMTRDGGNEFCGIIAQPGSNFNEIGGTQAGEGNVIAYNETGILINDLNFGNTISRNSIFCNSIKGIDLINGANNNIAPPSLSLVQSDTISGGAPADAVFVDVFVNNGSGCTNSPCQGKTFLGTATVDLGLWTLLPPFANGTTLVGGDVITTISQDNNGNSSEFSTCVNVTIVCTVQAAIASQTDASCGLANGSISTVATGGPRPYFYDIGNGLQVDSTFNNLVAGTYTVTVFDGIGCSTTTTTTLADIPGPTVTIGIVNDATCMQSDGSFSAVVSGGGTSPFTFDIGNGPIMDTLFTGLAAGNYTVTLTDFVGCTATADVTIANEGMVPSAAFGYTDVNGTVTFTNNSIDGLTYLWDFGDGNTSTEIDPVHTYAMDGNYTVCLTANNDCGSDIFCDVLNIIIPLAEVTIAGEIFKTNGSQVAQVEVSCTTRPNQTTGSDGYFEFTGLTAGMDYTITPYKNINCDNGLSVLDLVRIQRHLLFISRLDNPYDIIAADVTNDQDISIGDLVIIQRIILFDLDTFPNNTSWRFVDADHVFIDPENPFSPPFPESIDLPNLTSDALDQDFIAIKVGDVSGDANPQNFQAPSPLNFNVKDRKLVAGEEINVALSALQFEHIAGFQADMDFDTEVLELTQVEKGQLSDLRWGSRRMDEGLLPITWYDLAANTNGVGLENGTTILNLKFKVKQGGMNLSEVLRLTNNPLRNVAYDQVDQASSVNLLFDFNTNNVVVENKKLALYQNQPNPFLQSTVIPFSIPEEGEVQLNIYDLTGRLILRKEDRFSAGNNQVTMLQSDFPAKGIYFYELDFAGQKVIRRMIQH